MPIEDISHVRGGLLVVFKHPCGHLSNPLPYDTLPEAEAALPGMDAVPCWPCRTLAGSEDHIDVAAREAVDACERGDFDDAARLLEDSLERAIHEALAGEKEVP